MKRKIALLLAVASANSFGYMTKEQVIKQFGEAGHMPQMGKAVQYQKLDKVLPKHKRKKHKHKKHVEQFAKPRVEPTQTPVPLSTPSASPTTFPVATSGVDLRGNDATIKDQIGPYCTAYAMAAGIENLLGRGSDDLSERHIFSFYNEYSVYAAADNVPSKPITLNPFWPRENGKPKANYQANAKHKLVSISYLGDGEITKATESLDRRHPVYVGLAVPKDMASCRSTIRITSQLTDGGHAVLIVGYQRDANVNGGGYFIIKNSWSEGCGDGGYQYLPFAFCAKEDMYCEFYEMSKAE